MTQAQDAVRAGLVKVLPAVYVGAAGQPLAEAARISIDRLVVDSHLDLPDMFEIWFRDRDADVATLPAIAIGSQVIIGGHAPGESSSQQLVAGEVTAIEGSFAAVNRTVVRGYTRDHRLQRARRTRTFLNMKDSDIARKIANEAGLAIDVIEPTRIAHDHVGQVNQTDWEFLLWRVRLIGFQFGMSGGKFFFRKAFAPGGQAAVPLTFPHNLRTFRPRVTAGNLAGQAEVRIWDSLAAKVVSATADTAAGSVELAGRTPARLVQAFPAPPTQPQPRSTNPAVGDLGPDPSETAFVAADWALPAGTMGATATTEAAGGLARHLGSTFAEAQGEATGDPRLMAGRTVEVTGVSAMFSGSWVLTRARHEFDETGYHTRFEVSGRNERTLLGLASGGRGGEAPRIAGLVGGIVSNNNDPRRKGRVKVTLPWLSPRFESDWAPVVQAGAGRNSGALFLPEAGDQVVVGFEFGNPLRPYVIGGVLDNNSAYTTGGEPVKASGSAAAVVWRGIVSPTGNRLAFHDELPPGNPGQPPVGSDILLGTKNGTMSLAIDQVAGTVVLRCEPAAPDSKQAAGSLTISCGQGGTIDIRTGQGGTVNIDAGTQLNINAEGSIKIASKGAVEISGNPIKLN